MYSSVNSTLQDLKRGSGLAYKLSLQTKNKKPVTEGVPHVLKEKA